MACSTGFISRRVASAQAIPSTTTTPDDVPLIDIRQLDPTLREFRTSRSTMSRWASCSGEPVLFPQAERHAPTPAHRPPISQFGESADLIPASEWNDLLETLLAVADELDPARFDRRIVEAMKKPAETATIPPQHALSKLPRLKEE